MSERIPLVLNNGIIEQLQSGDSLLCGFININTSGDDALFSTYKGSNSAGKNIWIGGGGASAVGVIGATYHGSDNVSVGFSALNAITTGWNNVAVGASALSSNTTGNANVAIGTGALNSNVGGGDNIAIGSAALASAVNATGNVAMGTSALTSNISGTNNFALGTGALQANTSSSNVAIGTSALHANLTGSSQVAIGASALAAHTDGAFNIAIGSSTLAQNLDGPKNVAIGAMALYGNLHGTDNIAIGTYAGFYETGSNKLFIDNATRASETDARAKALIYGVFNASTASQLLAINGALEPIGLTAGRVIYSAAGTINTKLVDSANLTFDGTTLKTSLHYGEMYADNISQAVTISATNTPVQVSAGLSGGTQNGFTFQNARELKASVAGQYLITWSMSVSCPTANNQEVEGGVMVNAAYKSNGTSHAEVGSSGSNRPDVVAGTCIQTLAINDLVSLGVVEQTSIANLQIQHASLTIFRVGN